VGEAIQYRDGIGGGPVTVRRASWRGDFGMTERCFPAVFIGVFVRLGDAPRLDSS